MSQLLNMAYHQDSIQNLLFFDHNVYLCIGLIIHLGLCEPGFVPPRAGTRTSLCGVLDF